jgi:hypothetical protein
LKSWWWSIYRGFDVVKPRARPLLCMYSIEEKTSIKTTILHRSYFFNV